MIFFILAALADIISTQIAGRFGGIEGYVLLRFVPDKLRWPFQVTAYLVAAALAKGQPSWVWWLAGAVPAAAALNNVIRLWRAGWRPR